MKYIKGLIVLTILFHSTVSADQIFLKDGTQIIGKIESYSEKKVTIKTEFLGSITIDTANITGITSDKPYSIGSKSEGDYTGTFKFEENNQSLIEKDGESREIKLTDIDLVWGLDDPKPEPEKPNYWSGTLELSIIGENADKNDALIITRSRTHRDTDRNNLLLDFRYKYEINDNKTVENEYLFLGRYDWDRPDSEWRYFIKFENERDKFDNLDIRLEVVVGSSLKLIDEEHLQFIIRGGLGWGYAKFNNDDNVSEPTAEGGYEYEQIFNNFFEIEDSLRLNIIVTDPSDIRVVHEFASLIPIVESKDWKLKFGMINELQSDTGGDQSTWDTDYTISLVYNW